MFDLKPLSKDAIPRSLEKVVRYRLLNEPRVAESICRDILQTEPNHREALINLILSLTDQFGKTSTVGMRQVLEEVTKLQDEYETNYYTGIVYERQAKARLHLGLPGAGFDAYDLLHEAMNWFEKAEKMHPAGNEDAVLRWNSCARIIMSHNLQPRPRDDFEPLLE